jgi:spermidine/putrescine transport system permease protein
MRFKSLISTGEQAVLGVVTEHNRLVRRPYVLATMTWAYVAWSFLPVAVAFAVSVGYDPLSSTSGFDLSAYRAAFRGTYVRSVFAHSVFLAAGTVMVAVPLGTALGLGLAHLVRRRWRVLGGLLLTIIALPHVALGVALSYLFLFVVRVHLNTGPQLVGHITVALPFVALIVWTRALLLDPSYEEQAADLGAPPSSTVTRVLLPLCAPAIVVTAAVAFAVSFNELPLSHYLCTPPECQTVPMLLARRGGVYVPPRAIALGVIASGLSLAIFVVMLVLTSILRKSGRAFLPPASGHATSRA